MIFLDMIAQALLTDGLLIGSAVAAKTAKTAKTPAFGSAELSATLSATFVPPLFRPSGALHPILFMLPHLVTAHLVARILPAKRITYPLNMLVAVGLYTSEHFAAELPSLAPFSPVFGGLTFATLFYSFYVAFKRTSAPKSLIWAAIALFFGSLPVLKGLELGIPKDDVEEQKQANFDEHYAKWHMVVHAMILTVTALTSYGVSWAEPAVSKSLAADIAAGLRQAAIVPPSPSHSTRSPRQRGALVRTADECATPKRGFSAAWPKPKEA